MKPRTIVLLACLAPACACAPSNEPLRQDEFLVDGIRVMVPPPPGMTRARRGEGLRSGQPHAAPIAEFQANELVGATAILPGGLRADSVRHRERLELVGASWRARRAEPPSSLEHEARARLAAIAAGHADSADWHPVALQRSLLLDVEQLGPDAILRLDAFGAGPDERTTAWGIEALVLVRGRLLHLRCYDHRGGTLSGADSLRGTAREWVSRLRTANLGGIRRGRIRRG